MGVDDPARGSGSAAPADGGGTTAPPTVALGRGVAALLPNPRGELGPHTEHALRWRAKQIVKVAFEKGHLSTLQGIEQAFYECIRFYNWRIGDILSHNTDLVLKNRELQKENEQLKIDVEGWANSTYRME